MQYQWTQQVIFTHLYVDVYVTIKRKKGEVTQQVRALAANSNSEHLSLIPRPA